MNASDLILQWTIAALVGGFLCARGRLSLFHPATVYLAFHLVVFCLRPTVLFAAGLDGTWTTILASPDAEYLRQALWVSSAGLVSFTLACTATTFRSRVLHDEEPAEMDASDRRALVVAAAIFVGPAIAGGMLGIGSTRHSGYIVDLQFTLVPLALLTVLARSWSVWSLLPVGALICMQALSGSPVPVVVGSGLLLTLLWLWNHRRSFPSMPVLVAGGLGLVALLLLTGEGSPAASWLGFREAPAAATSTGPGLADQVDRRSWAHIEALAAAIAVVPDKAGEHTFGRQHLASAVAALASSAHSPLAAAEAAGVELGRQGRFRGLPFTLVSDGWISGGWVGVVLTLALAGTLMGAGFAAFARHPGDRSAVCFFLPVHILALGLYTSADTALIHRAAYLAAPLLAWRLLATRMRRSTVAMEERERLREERHRKRLLGTALLNPNAADIPPEVLRGAGAPGDDSAGSAAEQVAPSPTPSGAKPARWRDSDPR